MTDRPEGTSEENQTDPMTAPEAEPEPAAAPEWEPDAAPEPEPVAAGKRVTAADAATVKVSSPLDPALRVRDSVSKVFVIATVAIFIGILVYGMLGGNGGMITGTPTPAPSASPSDSAVPSESAGPSTSAAPSDSAAPSASAEMSPVPSGSVAPSPS